MNPPDDRPPSTFAAPTPVVLRIMPKAGSSAPIGYVYDPDPLRNGGEGGLLAASAAFFTYQSHEVFWDPCPDLAAYCRAGRITSTIVKVDRLPDHILATGLDLLDSLPPSSKGDILGMSFMAEYLPTPPPAAAPQGGPVSLSPPHHGRSGGSLCSFTPAAQSSFSVPSPSARSVGGRPRPDPEPDVHASSLAHYLGSGRLPSSVGYGGQYGSRSGRSPSSSLSSISQSHTNSEILRGWSNSSDMLYWGSLTSSNASVPPGSIDASILGPSSPFATPSPTKMAPGTSPSLPVAPQPNPIPLPVDRFMLPMIKNATNYLAACDLILYWRCCPGFSTARSDSALITDLTNALASQFWEGQIRTALKDGGDARFLFKNTGSTYYDKGFEMLQVLKDHYRSSSISNTFTTLLSLFNDKQSDTEGIHEFCS
jgi:hypothetical protein